MTTFLAPRLGATFVTRGGTYTSDSNTGMILNVPTGGYDQADLQNEGCVMLAYPVTAPFRNLLDGGDMTTNPFQRNVAGIQSAANVQSAIAGSPVYFADRWFAMGGSSSSIYVAVSADTSVPGFANSLAFNRVAANANAAAITLAQSLEYLSSVRCQGQQVCFSFWARANSQFSGSSFTAAVMGGTGTNQAGSAQVAVGWTGQTTIASGAITPTSTMTRYSVAGSVGTNITQLGVQISWTPSGTASAGDGLYLNGFQLELGNTPSPFEKRDPVVELQRCQRFAYVIPEPAGTSIVVGSGTFTGAAAFTGFIPLPVTMRAVPTLTLSIGSFTAGSAAFVVATSIVTGGVMTTSAISVKTAAGSTGTAGGAGLLTGTGGNGYIIATADL